MGENKEKKYKRQNEYIRNNFDRISITLPAGSKEKIKSLGYSVNNYLNELVKQDFEKRGLSGSDQDWKKIEIM